MTLLLYAICSILFSIGLYFVLQAALSLPSGKATSALRSMQGKKGFAQCLQDALLPMARLLAKLFPMSEYRAKRMEADFSRLRIVQTPRDYVSSAITKSLLLALLGLIFIPLGIPLLALLTAVAALLAYFQQMQTIRKRVEVQNREIEAELPRLVETLGYTLQDSRDLLTFFEKYRHVSGTALGAELDWLIADIKMGNQEAALRRMDARLGLSSFAALCAVLCGVYQGVDQQTSLFVLEQDLRTKERETIRRSLEKRPGRIKAASLILTVLMILMFMVPLVLLIINNLQAVGI